MDDVVCGLCGTVGEVYYGDGNSKNCCTVKGVSKIYITNNYYVQFNYPLIRLIYFSHINLTANDINYLLFFRTTLFHLFLLCNSLHH